LNCGQPISAPRKKYCMECAAVVNEARFRLKFIIYDLKIIKLENPLLYQRLKSELLSDFPDQRDYILNKLDDG
jgi:hypothetical protein